MKYCDFETAHFPIVIGRWNGDGGTVGNDDMQLGTSCQSNQRNGIILINGKVDYTVN